MVHARAPHQSRCTRRAVLTMSEEFAHPIPLASADPGRGVHATSHGASMLRGPRARSPGNRRPGLDAHGRAPA
eukprot:7043383-Alexandrium_andersonii.AAC.1